MKVRRNNSQSTTRVRLQWTRKVNSVVLKAKLLPKKKEKNHTKTKPQPQTPSSQVESHKHTHTGLDEAEPMRPASGRCLIIPTQDTVRNGKETGKTKTKQNSARHKKERVGLFGRRVPDGKPVFNRRVAFPDQVGLSLLRL